MCQCMSTASASPPVTIKTQSVDHNVSHNVNMVTEDNYTDCRDRTHCNIREEEASRHIYSLDAQ